MRAAALMMVERGRLQEAALIAAPTTDALVKATTASDQALARTQRALLDAGLPATGVEQVRERLTTTRSRAVAAAQSRSALREPMEEYNRLVEDLDGEVSLIERGITLANPSVGLVVSLARRANDIRATAGLRGVLLNTWFSGKDLAPAQKDELQAINGRIAGAWDRLQRGVRTVSVASAAVEAVTEVKNAFSTQKELRYREMVKAAVTGAERPMDHARYRAWHVAALEELLRPRDALLDEAAAQAAASMEAARSGLLAAAGVAVVSLGLVAAAVLGLLRGLVEPVRGMTVAMTALAGGDLTAGCPAQGRLREIGAMTAAVAVFRDNVASLHRRENELQCTNLRFTAALENMSQGLAMYDADERLAVSNRRFCDITGLPPEQITAGMTYREVIGLCASAGHFPGRTADQAYAERCDHIAWIGAATHDGQPTGGRAVAVRYEPMVGGGWVSTFEDVTERRANEARIMHMAHHDALTDLPNRVLFREHMERVLPRVRRGSSAAVLCLDLDGFKGVNDTLGHPAGDELLRLVARRLRDNTRETDLLARLGGDEFAIIQADAQQPVEAAALADRLVAALRAPFDLQGQQVEIGASIGVALAAGTAAADELLRNADIALYRAKAEGRGTWRFFEPGMDAEIQQRRQMETDLRRAVAEEQFEVHYQPLVDASTRALTGFEALARWRHPSRGMVPPAEFIPFAEETGLIQAIGTWVLNRACTDAAAWPEYIKVAVNLSPLQFIRGDLVREVQQALAASGLPAGRLELEITESVLLQDNEATLKLLHRLRALGVRISMDDFGTGYSSLSYLRRFPFDKIKIDQSFIRSLEREQGSIEIIRAVVGLGKALGMDVLAEGVETAEQLSILQIEGCDELQGYLFSKPRPVQDLPGIIAGHPRPRDGSSASPARAAEQAAA